jgi:hypothetical protein
MTYSILSKKCYDLIVKIWGAFYSGLHRNSFPSNQEFLQDFMKLANHYHVDRGPLLGPILDQMGLVHNITPYLFYIYFNILYTLCLGFVT